MPSSGRRSEELQKKLQTRSTFLKPSDFTKEPTLLERVRKSKDPVEKSKAALSDLRKRIDERKKTAKLISVQNYQEGREETAQDVTTCHGSPALSRENPSSNEKTLAKTIKKSVEKEQQAQLGGNGAVKDESQRIIPDRGLKKHYTDPFRYRRDMIGEEEKRAPPSQIEVRSNAALDGDEHSEVSEITTDIRILSTTGANYIERRMAGKVQMRLMKPSLSGPPGRYLEKDVNINVNNLSHLGKVVEQAKIDLQHETTNILHRRHGLPYEDTDYRASVDEDEEGDSWEDVIHVSRREQRNIAESNDKKTLNLQDPPARSTQNENESITPNSPARKLQHLVKEAYSYEGDVFIDATEVREEDLDDIEKDSAEEVRDLSKEDGTYPNGPIEVEDVLTDEEENLPIVEDEERLAESKTVEPRQDTFQPTEEHKDSKESYPTEPVESGNERDQSLGPAIADGESKVPDDNSIGPDDISIEGDETKPPSPEDKKSSMASDFYESSLVFFRSFCGQVDTQIKSIQEKGLISKGDMDRMLGVLENDVDETKSQLPEGGDDVVVMFGDELEATACGTGLEAVDGNRGKEKGSNGDPVEKMMESLKQTCEFGMAKCGLAGSLIKENTKAIENIITNLKKVDGGSCDDERQGGSENESSEPQFEFEPDPGPEDEFDDGQLKERSAKDVEDDTMKIQFI
eukprot:CAMPEP_0172367314 /NCGR_PEP_ID=MMETSP1060-20121228/20506_1 /TAXON_ID=37318 /ORGANISM="Pseudo-nitzschia pungens, Strain cf. cingulata" /LENGTH=686 /DNA_ID=CAMNT_0013091509 /DNA_START=138 /DNA_END=2198 /DNA_ORIENTATION=-